MSESISAGLMAAVLMSLVHSAIALPPIAATRAEPKMLIPEKTVVPACAKLQSEATQMTKVRSCFFIFQAYK
jgi:xanthosine utilization system XapX-like protein